MNIQVKTFKELTTEDLYAVLQLRSEVFVVEQNCVYQDVDGKDEKAFHVLGMDNNRLVAYTRVFKPGDYFNEASIGRVVVQESFRRYGAGSKIMKATLEFISKSLKEQTIRISAQTYLKRFYNDLGFKEVGEEYLEDGIPHVNMTMKL